jgi:hypothetical protein
MSSLILFIAGGFTTGLLFLGILYYVAFGSAKCTGINPPAAIFFTVVIMIILFIAFNSIDWLNDWISAGTATKAARAGQRDMVEAFRGQQAQSNALNALLRTMSQQAKTEQAMTPPEPGPQVPLLGDGGLVFDQSDVGFMDDLSEEQ